MPEKDDRFVPFRPSVIARRDLFVPRDPDDAIEINRLRHEIVHARRHQEPDQLALQDAADRAEFALRHTLIYRVGSVVEHFGRGRFGRALERHTAGRQPVTPPPFPDNLDEQYTRWFELAGRYVVDEPTRWADDTVALVIVGSSEDALTTVASFKVQQRPTDVIVEVRDADDLADELVRLSQHVRPSPRWLMVVSAGSVLTKDSVSLLVHAAGDGDGAFGDEDHIDQQYHHFSPTLKCDEPGPFSALGHHSMGEAVMYRRSALPELDTSMGSAVIHDASLKLSERQSSLAHVPLVLVSRPERTPSYVEDDDLVRATNAALRRRRWGGDAQRGSWPGLVEWRPGDPSSWPSVQIVITVRDHVEKLRRCITSIESHTDYPHVAITIVDNGSSQRATLDYLKSTRHRVVSHPGPVSYASAVNAGVASGDADFVLTVANTVEATSPEWLNELVRVADLPSVGIVGAFIVDRDGIVIESGVTVADDVRALSFPSTYPTDDANIRSTRDVIAVSRSCQLVRRDLWNKLGGHDETLELRCSEIDLSLRAREAGWRTVVVSPARLIDHEAPRDIVGGSGDEIFAYRWGLGDGFIDPHATPLITYEPSPRFKFAPLGT